MRILWGVIPVVLLGSYLLRAQIFNLEDEDKVVVQREVASKVARPARPAPVRVNVADIPEEPEEKRDLDKLYGQILSQLQANNVEAATKIMSQHDVMTKQKIVNRLMKEYPLALNQGSGPESPSDLIPQPAQATQFDDQ